MKAVRLRARYWLKAEVLADRLDRSHLTHAEFADVLGISCSYWSQIFNKKRPLSPQMRRWLLHAPSLAGLSEDQLWERCA